MCSLKDRVSGSFVLIVIYINWSYLSAILDEPVGGLLDEGEGENGENGLEQQHPADCAPGIQYITCNGQCIKFELVF